MTTQNQQHGEGLSAAADEVKRRATGAAEEARRAGEERADGFVEQVGRRGDRVAEALRSTGSSLRGKEDWLADAAESLGDNVEQLSRTAREKGVRGMKNDLEGLARSRPVLFMGAAVTLGVALGRLLRSSPPEEQDLAGRDRSQAGYGRSGESSSPGQPSGPTSAPASTPSVPPSTTTGIRPEPGGAPPTGRPASQSGGLP